MPPPSYDRRAVWSWYFFDFANSPFTTLVVTFIYAAYFTKAIASDEVRGTDQWSMAVTATALLVALTSPFLGAIADRGGHRKLFLAVLTAVNIGACLLLFGVLPGQVFLALSLFVVANVAFELGLVFYNAFLPDIAPTERIGRISGYGWGFGYVGGLAALVVALVTLVQPEVPWFGFSTEAGQNIRASNLLVAIWFTVFSLPLFFWVRQAPAAKQPFGQLLRDSYTQLRASFTGVRRYRQVVRFLVARLVYNDGLVTIFAFGGIYAAGTFGFTFQEILAFGIVLNVCAGLGAFAMGYLDDRLGGKKVVAVSLWCLIAASLLAVLAPSKAWFWAAGIVVGIFSGPNQAASRSLMGRFVPAEKETEFFGFFAFSGKATAFLGPFLLGKLTLAFGSQRAGVAVVIAFFAVGLWLLSRVDEREGIVAAKTTVPDV